MLAKWDQYELEEQGDWNNFGEVEVFTTVSVEG